MRILFLSNFYPPLEIGGYEQWCEEVANGLLARGHELLVLTSQYGVTPDYVEPLAHVRRTLFLQTDNDYYRPVDFFRHRAAQEQFNLQELAGQAAAFQPDVIMVWGMWNFSQWLPHWAEQHYPGRVAYFISNYWPADLDLHRQYWQLPANRAVTELLKRPVRSLALARLEREGYPPELRFTHAVCCSEYVRDTLVAAGKLPASAGVLLGGTDPTPFLAHNALARQRAADEPLKLLYFGRLIHDKGVHTAIEALLRLHLQDPTAAVELTILGSGHPDYEHQLRQMVAAFGLQTWVRFVQQVPRTEIPAWLGRFDVFLFTSIWPEPMARSVMEAMAAGLLVIGTPVGGQAEMLAAGDNALTFPAEDAGQLAEQIDSLLRDPERRQTLAQAGQEMVLAQFTITRMVEEIEALLMSVADLATVRA